MSTESHGFIILSPKGFYNLGPQHTGRPHLGNLHKVVFANSPEEGQTLSKGIYRQTSFDTGTDILQTISQSVAQLNISCSTSLLHMIAGNGNTVELRHIFGGIFKNITDNTHGHFWWVNISITHHEFLENIVLNSTSHNLFVYTLLLTGKNIESQNRQYRTVHGHRYRHLIQGNTAEQNTHIQNGVNSNTSLTYITQHTRII